ncbi:MAG: acetylglutamate kinase [Planctomycetota bacterium]
MSAAQRILVKVGGAILDDAAARAAFAASVRGAIDTGHSVVVVHGGGMQVSRLTVALGLEVRRVRGLRVTDDATARAVLQVLGGEVNSMLVAALQAAGVDAIGVTGADGALFAAQPVDADLGRVGAVESVTPDVLARLGGAGFVPVVATVTPAPGETDVFLNVNADAAVAPIAAAWGADAVLFLSDVAHVLDGGARVPALDRAAAQALETSGAVTGGMVPKVDAALDAAEALPRATVKIASGSTPDCIAAGLDADLGTLVTATPQEARHG